MHNGFALELKSDLNLDLDQLEHCYYQIYKYSPIDERDLIFIYTDRASVDGVVAELVDYNIVQDVHELVYFPEAVVEGSFYDYGWEGKYFYLFKDLIQPFKIVDGDATQIKMVQFQIEEDLIAYNINEETFFVDVQNKPLIEGYAAAYGVTVKFL